MINIPEAVKTHFVQFNLNDLIAQLGEDQVKTILSSFSCPLSPDVEYFLKYKAIEMSKRNFSKTYLVFWETDDKSEQAFVGYYALAAKFISVEPAAINGRIRTKLRTYGIYDNKSQQFIANATLIGQLGKNFAKGNDTLISGSDLLQLAIDKAKDVQKLIGGRFVYLECEDNEKLLDFYARNSFIRFGTRNLDRDEVTTIHGQYLVQLFTLL